MAQPIITIILGSGRLWRFVSFAVLTPKIAARVACGEKVSSLSWRRKGRFVEFVGGEHYIVFSLSMVRHLCIGFVQSERERQEARGKRQEASAARMACRCGDE